MADMPFMTYASKEQALDNAVRLMQEGGAKMVKLEGGAGQVEIVEFLANHDIAVCAHLGLKPQSVHKVGGFRVQGREEEAAERMLRDAQALEAAGADIVLLECIPAALGKHITEQLHVPVIGIGAGPDTGRPDPGAVRRARYHVGPQTEVLEKFPRRPRQRAGSDQGVYAGREVEGISRPRALFLNHG